MANHSASEKSIRKIVKRSAVNKNRRTRVRTYIKKVLNAVEGKISDIDPTTALIAAQSEIMRAVSKGLIKKNTASRKISRLAKKVKEITGASIASVLKTTPVKSAVKETQVGKNIKPADVTSKNEKDASSPKKKASATTRKKVVAAE